MSTTFLGSWFEYAQLALNGLLVTLLLFLILRQRAEKNSLHKETYDKVETIVESLVKIAKEHEVISKQFEANLETKRSLILELTAQLDQLINRAAEVISRLERIIEEAKEIETSSSVTNPEHERILSLARKGFTVQSIAHQVNKPVGEVELIINLYKATLNKRK
ncbi:MAG: hypothetical protein N2260_06095 [Syntrophobacterales bacterium]|nr:hypothetical protein [Syntrophobacterales bacterium]